MPAASKERPSAAGISFLRRSVLFPRCDVESHRFAREIGAHFLFVVRGDGTPGLNLGAREFLRLIILSDYPI